MLHLYTTWITLLELLMRAVMTRKMMTRKMMTRKMMTRKMMTRAMMRRTMSVIFENRAVLDTKNDSGTALY
jgi:hypothetical protein